MANSDHLMGALLLTVTVLALAEVARPLRFLNLPIGAWLLAAPWFLEGGSMGLSVGSLVSGVTRSRPTPGRSSRAATANSYCGATIPKNANTRTRQTRSTRC